MRHPSGHVHRVQDAEEGRGLVRPGRTEAKPGRRLLRERSQQPGVLRVRYGTNSATGLLSTSYLPADVRSLNPIIHVALVQSHQH